jgi:hypothetical protein
MAIARCGPCADWGTPHNFVLHLTQSVFCPAACATYQPAQRVMAPVGKKRVGRNRTGRPELQGSQRCALWVLNRGDGANPVNERRAIG